MTSLLAALASIPRIASSLELLAKTFTEINRRATKAKAVSRRKDKDDQVEQRIAALVDARPSGLLDGEAGELGQADGAPGISGGGDTCTCLHCGCSQNNQPT